VSLGTLILTHASKELLLLTSIEKSVKKLLSLGLFVSTMATGLIILPAAKAQPMCPQITLDIRYSVNTSAGAINSYNDFTVTDHLWYCATNSVVYGNPSVPNSQKNYRRARYALKVLTDTSTVTSPPYMFKPFKWGANYCTTSQNTNGLKFDLDVTSTPSKAKVKFCRGFISGGVGDDARAKSTIKDTLKYYYPNKTVEVRDRFGNLI
jgi:hypothetical protein